jgi:FlaA1/EpsC-like NDP-sugar epimerase
MRFEHVEWRTVEGGRNLLGSLQGGISSRVGRDQVIGENLAIGRASGGGTTGRDAWRVRVVKSVARVRTDIPFAVIDAFLIVMAYMTALVLRFLEEGTPVPSFWWNNFLVVLPFIVAVHLVANVLFGTYGHVWEYASVAEAVRIVGAAVTAAIVLLVTTLTARLAFHLTGPVPLSVLAIGAMLTLGGMGAVRFRSRLFSFNRIRKGRAQAPRRTLIVGTGRAAVNLARYASSDGQPMEVLGFVSPHTGNGHRRLAGLPVLGGIDEVPELVERFRADELVVASDDAPGLAKRLIDLCLAIDVRLRIMPDIGAVLNGNGNGHGVRDLEASDLLPRPAVSTDLNQLSSVLSGKRVLVTGAGGSIGSELVRQILRFEPETVIALDHDETHLHEAMLGWSDGKKPVPLLCDIRDPHRLERVFAAHQPEVIFHAAAHKHVPILEVFPEEAVNTNVLGTAHLIDAAERWGAERFVLISTDKAADPSSVMGSSKRVAEMLVQAASARRPTCIYSAVRFGNVLGSRGSVVPTFMEQIRRGGPVTVTDPDMMRYFMTVDEAVELVLQAAALAAGGEVFVLDMGEPVRIMDLARRLIRLAGLVPGRDIQVNIVGKRPGEKLTEILSTLPLRPSSHPQIGIAEPAWPGAVTLLDAVDLLGRAAQEGKTEVVQETLHALARRDWRPYEVLDLSDQRREPVLEGGVAGDNS